jgi:hypothetical protein
MMPMSERLRSGGQERPGVARPARAATIVPGASGRDRGPSPGQALMLQRAAGNRATARVLARWSAHPDKDKKGVLLTDAAAGEYQRFNLPLSK